MKSSSSESSICPIPHEFRWFFLRRKMCIRYAHSRARSLARALPPSLPPSLFPPSSLPLPSLLFRPPPPPAAAPTDPIRQCPFEGRSHSLIFCPPRTDHSSWVATSSTRPAFGRCVCVHDPGEGFENDLPQPCALTRLQRHGAGQTCPLAPAPAECPAAPGARNAADNLASTRFGLLGCCSLCDDSQPRKAL